MVLVWIVIGGIAVQFILAKYTAEDAHSRGHDETQWFLLVMIFGIFAIIIYLLTRNDRRIPESERPPNNLNLRLGSALLYLGSIAVAFFAFVVLEYQYDIPSVRIGSEGMFIESSFLMVLVVPPLLVYLERSRGILGRYF